MIATDIAWEVDITDGISKLSDMDYEDAAKVLEINPNVYANMSTTERDDYAYEFFRSSLSSLYEFIGLPESVEIPKELGDDEDEISDWLSDTYEYCHSGFNLEEGDSYDLHFLYTNNMWQMWQFT